MENAEDDFEDLEESDLNYSEDREQEEELNEDLNDDFNEELDEDLNNVEYVTKSRRRLATVYDAVVGRVKDSQAIRKPDDPRPQSPPRLQRHSTRDIPLAPDEVLFRRRGAPQRFAEHDIYACAERDLPRGGGSGCSVLPDSDLLHAVHGYSSRFYAAMDREQRRRRRRDDDGPGAQRGSWRGKACADERSMDETALMAFGILLEEAGREVLGRRGDMVFTEGEEGSDDVGGGRGGVAKSGVGDDDDEEEAAAVEARKSKRRRVVKHEDT